MLLPLGTPLRLRKAPIVEAVLDLYCSMPDGFDVKRIEAEARELLRTKYPKMRQSLILEGTFAHQAGQEPAVSSKNILRGYQFLSEDEKRIVQFRVDGFSFNKLAPYTVLDDYLADIKEAWDIFCKVCKPTLVTRVGLRNINRIDAIVTDGKTDLGRYLRICPHLPDEDNLTFTGFLNNHQAKELSTGILVNLVLTSQPVADGALPLILDIEAYKLATYQPSDAAIWESDLPSIRNLKDRMFASTLSESCLNAFQPH